MFSAFVRFVRELYESDQFIPLHEPRFIGKEKEFLLDTIDSTFVSSVGRYVELYEEKIAEYTGAAYGVSTVNGTSALHVALLLAGVKPDDEIITQPLTFAATCAAICYCGATPVFVDVDKDTLGMSSVSLEEFLELNGEVRDDICWNKQTGKVIRACVPMHTFGHPLDIEAVGKICDRFSITLIEDAAESLGSTRKGLHTGRTGALSIFSFNGNKIITTGGGGMIVTDDKKLAAQAKHLTTTAKKPHPWNYEHDMVGYNYRMPNLNAALGCAQLQNLNKFIKNKRKIASCYQQWCDDNGFQFFSEPPGTRSNYWLNTLIMDNRQQRDKFLQLTNEKGVMTRPVWVPMHKLPMYKMCFQHDLKVSEWLEERLVNIPSSVIIND